MRGDLVERGVRPLARQRIACAYPTSTCASGPTCIGLPSKRGALTQEYFLSSFQSVKCGIGLALPRMQRLLPLVVPGVRHVFGDASRKYASAGRVMGL